MSIKCMTEVWEIEGLSPSQKLVLLALADHAGDDHLCWPSLARLAKRSDMSVRNVRRILRHLEDDGYVVIVEQGAGRGKTATYQVVTNPAKKPDNLSSFSNREIADNGGIKPDNLSPLSETGKPDIQGQKADIGGIKPDTQGLKPDTEGRKADIDSHTREELLEPPTDPSVMEPPQQPCGRGGLTQIPASSEQDDFQRIAEAWQSSGFRPAVSAVGEHLERWQREYGAEEVLKAIGIAVLSDPDKPGAFVDGVLRKRRADREVLAREREGVEYPPDEFVSAITPSSNGCEPEVIQALRQVPQLSSAPMRLDEDAGDVLIEHPNPDWADLQLRKVCHRTLKIADLDDEWTFSFSAGDGTA